MALFSRTRVFHTRNRELQVVFPHFFIKSDETRLKICFIPAPMGQVFRNCDTFVTTMASTALEEKINKIRQKNEEIRRRHEEVEADKQNAAKLNALVKMVPPTDWPERKEPPEFSNPAPPPARSNGNHKGRTPGREHRGQQRQYHAAGGDGKKTHVFAEGDGPPPDPTYNFLADSEREERTREDSRDNDRFRGRGGGPPRGGLRRRGGGREGYSKEYRGSPGGPKDSSKPEYEAWRAERNRIDEARISRQRTAEGNWRREWDNNKINVGEDEAGATKPDIGDTGRKEHKEFDKWQKDGNDPDSPRGRGGKPYVSRGTARGSHNNRVYQHSNSFEQFHAPVSPSPTKPPVSPNGIDERTVIATEKSIKVTVNHSATTPKGPVMSVKVSSSSIAGTGRVGPRQKPRVLYSSQSESEVPGQETEKYASHKSPDDKANRVSFNRDVEEQQRYVLKSPHPQRKGESNLKSPYSTRKEFKYDSQQQRHGEVEPKSPRQQRKEFKEPPKSPHFQRKGDFNNREPHAKQKNNNLANETFKSNHPQRRTAEKAKYDSQKSSGPRKAEDSFAPKPQRINKRNDKSKNFQHVNPKESEEPNATENNTRSDKVDSSKLVESSKDVTNGDEIRDETSETKNKIEKKVTENSGGVETVEDIQENVEAIPEPNIISETLSPSMASAKVDESLSDDKKSTDDFQTIVPCAVDPDKSPEFIIASDKDAEMESSGGNIEIKTVPEIDLIPNLVESKTVECNEVVKNPETIEKSLEITEDAKKEIDVPTNIENKTSDNGEGNVKNISDDESKREENLTPTGVDSSEKLEEKTLDVPLEPEKFEDKIQRTEDTKSIGDDNKVDSVAVETVAPENSEEQVLKDIDKGMINDSENNEKTII